MKIKSTSLAVMAFSALAAVSGNGATIAYWNFNTLTASTNNGTTYAPTSGSGSITLAGWTTTGSTGITSFGGSTVNALNSDPSGQSLSLQGGASTGTPNNGATMTFSFVMTGLTDPIITFATQKTSTGFISNQVSYSTDGTAFTPFGTPYNPATSYAVQTIDLSSISALDNAATAFVRITFSGATGTTGNNRIDNVQINAVPEPSAALLGAFGALALLRRRR
ncbi:PEP-CTERM sorting domain-containing protein [Akkermansiaceae bacterium]|nr:PEP-CTERM sorting domain-containing protein [Akkermansiaceae bacterium]